MMGVWLPNLAVNNEQIAFLRPDLADTGLENALTVISLPIKPQGPDLPEGQDVYIITVFLLAKTTRVSSPD